MVLDIGGGSFYGDPLEKSFSGCELTLVNRTRSNIETWANSINADGVSLPLRNKVFDFILSLDTIEHLNDPDGLIDESHRVMKDDGWFVVSSPNLTDIYSRVCFLFGYTPFAYGPSLRFRVASPFGDVSTPPDHKSVFPFKGMRQLLIIHGFNIVKSYGYTYADPYYLQLIGDEAAEKTAGFERLRRALNHILPASLKEGMLFICKKRKGVEPRPRITRQ